MTSARIDVVLEHWPIDETADQLLGQAAAFADALPEQVPGCVELRARWRAYADWRHFWGLHAAKSKLAATRYGSARETNRGTSGSNAASSP